MLLKKRALILKYGLFYMACMLIPFVEKQQQQIDLLTKTAEQRYQELMNKNPEIIQRIAQKHIASYLGITTQSLSRIRNNM